MQSTMTNNGVRKIGNFGNVVYDSGNDAANGRKRIGISATEIEMLDDLPPYTGSGSTNSGNNLADRTRAFGTQIPASSTAKQNNYQTLSLNRDQTKGNVIYQDVNNQELNSAVDQLLEKYAPDALPQNLLNSANNRRAPAQVNIVTARDQPPVSTYQTSAPPSSTTSHNYSTIIRPNTEQTSQIQTETQRNNNNNDNNNMGNSQPPTRSRVTTNYDSFQHVIPPTQQQQWQPQQQQQWQPPPPSQQQQQQQQQQWQPQQQQQQKPQTTVPIKTKNGHLAQVVPGKIYNLDEDPLHLLYDRQNPSPPTSQQPTFNAFFQPTGKPQTVPNPSNIMYSNIAQRYPQQPLPPTVNPNSNGAQPFDLENLIKRVQQDYLREIQPFVSSVKFVEKDREYGQSLADVGFVTPVTIRKGFSKQADDILRRSFGRKNRRAEPGPRSADHYEDNTYSEDDDEDEDDISDLNPANRHRPLEKDDSKQSFTSVTSASTASSDYVEHHPTLNNLKNKIKVHDQGTSPPPQADQPKSQGQVQKTLEVPSKLNTTMESYDEEEEESIIANPPPLVVKPAKRVTSGDGSDTSSGSDVSDDEETRRATYNEHQSNPPIGIQTLAASIPVTKPDELTRERIVNAESQAAQRSEDIHPTPPKIHPSQVSNDRTLMNDNSEESESDDASEGEDPSVAYNEQPQASAIARPTAPQTTPSVAPTRVVTTPQTTARTPGAPTTQNPITAPRTTADNNPRQPATSGAPTTQNPSSAPRTTADNNPRQLATSGAPTTQNPTSAPRTTADNNPRQPAASGANITVPQDQRITTNNRTNSTPAMNQPVDAVQTGSGRFFQTDNAPKSGTKRGSKEAPSSIGDKIKSIFRRK